MKESEFWLLMDDEFGTAYAGYLSKSLHLTSLKGHTAVSALAAGISPRLVWNAVCDQQEVPESRRLGVDRGKKSGDAIS